MNLLSPTHRILIVEDFPIMRAGMRDLAQTLEGVRVCGETGSPSTVCSLIRETSPTVAVISATLCGGPGDSFRLLREMLHAEPSLRVLVLSARNSPRFAVEAFQAGAKGFVLKEEGIEVFREALRQMLRTGTFVSPRLRDEPIMLALFDKESRLPKAVDRLSSRESEVFRLMGEGHSIRDAAAKLQLSPKTVESHRSKVTEKLGFENAVDTARFAGDWLLVQAAGNMRDGS